MMKLKYNKYKKYIKKINIRKINIRKINNKKKIKKNNKNIIKPDNLKNFIKNKDFDKNFFLKFYNIKSVNNISKKFKLNNLKKSIYNKKKFFKLYNNFNINYYKNFNSNLKKKNDIQLMRHYHFIGNLNNKTYFSNDFNVKNYHENIDYKKYLSIKPRKTIKDMSTLKENFSFRKGNYHIYNKESFYKYFNDFDLEYYKKTYCNDLSDEFKILNHYYTIGRKNGYSVNSKIKIIIYTPTFNINCGGVVVLHYLAKLINDQNHPIFYTKIFNYFNIRYNNIFCNNFAHMDEIDNNTIVIYPEKIIGNPLNSKNVIRWMLLDLGTNMQKERNYGDNDLIYFWEPQNTDNIYFRDFSCPYFNNTFINKNLEKNKTCYIIKKAHSFHNQINFIHDENSICIDNLDIYKINEIFNECKYFYAYDPNTAFIIYAVVCGCIPIIYPIENVSKEEYFSNRIFNYKGNIYDKGIAYGNDILEIENAQNNLLEGIEEFKNLFNNISADNINKFMNDLEDNYINNNKLTNIVKNYYS